MDTTSSSGKAARRRDFDLSEECKAFVAALNREGTEPTVTEEAEARAEEAAAELLVELDLDASPYRYGQEIQKEDEKRQEEEIEISILSSASRSAILNARPMIGFVLYKQIV